MLVLDAHDSTAPCASKLLVLVVLLVEGLAECFKVLEIFLLHLSEGQASSILLMNELAEVGLSTHEAVGNPTLAAEGGQEDHHFDGVDIVGNHNELSAVLFDQLGDVVQAELNVDRLGSSLR